MKKIFIILLILLLIAVISYSINVNKVFPFKKFSVHILSTHNQQPFNKNTSLIYPLLTMTPVPTFSASSPESITQTYYTAYLTCMKHINLKNNHTLIENCPLDLVSGISTGFINKKDNNYTNRIFCDEGLPISFQVGQASYINNSAQLIVTTIFRDVTYTIPVTLQQTNDIWEITDIACDLDGHID